MARLPAGESATTSFRWEEVSLSNEKGRREIHYYVTNRGRTDLVVVGREKTLRHMSYHYALRNLPDSLPKLRSRRDVIHFLHSLSGKSTDGSSPLDASREGCEMGDRSFKDTQSQSQSLQRTSSNFIWLGSPWLCRKKRKHYDSFQRNGVKVSIHDFVYVLAEEGKRLVAYLDDMYEDCKGNKMVVVRWYHKIDEVGLVLPRNYNDREVFFSLCLQDLSIECIDGLATVLSPQHFDRFLNVAKHVKPEPFVCHKQFENDNVEPFDVTQVKGYWKQNLLRYMYTLSPSTNDVNTQQTSYDPIAEASVDAVGVRPRNRHRTERRRSSNGHFEVGLRVEVFSQDSGLRGCWFRASIIKKRNDKLKVRYEDIQDAADEANKLEEWILASRVASADGLGLRTSGRAIVRPAPESGNSQVSWAFGIGSVVDVWWHDGWWEGIVVSKESDDRFRVFCPDEKLNSVFARKELRHSQEWIANGWVQIKERQDIVPLILRDLDPNRNLKKSGNDNLKPLTRDEFGLKDSRPEVVRDGKIKDLSKDDRLSRLKWKTSKKRRLMIPPSLNLDQENCKFGPDSLYSSVVSSLTSLVMSR